MIKLRNMPAISLLLLTFAVFNPAVYAGPGQGHGGGHAKGHQQAHGKAYSHGKGKVKNTRKVKSVTHAFAKKNAKNFKKITFTNKNKMAITNYYKSTPFKTGTLPPGIAMNLARGKPLPPGIQKVFLPQDLTNTLPRYPGYEYLGVGSDVVLVNSRTGVVADILENVLK